LLTIHAPRCIVELSERKQGLKELAKNIIITNLMYAEIILVFGWVVSLAFNTTCPPSLYITLKLSIYKYLTEICGYVCILPPLGGKGEG
jgi:hypothetical protein